MEHPLLLAIKCPFGREYAVVATLGVKYVAELEFTFNPGTS